MIAIEFGDQFAEAGAFGNEHAVGPGLRDRVQGRGGGNAMAREAGLLAGMHYQSGIGGGGTMRTAPSLTASRVTPSSA